MTTIIIPTKPKATGSRSGSANQYYYSVLIDSCQKYESDEKDKKDLYSALEWLVMVKNVNITEARQEKGKHRYHLHCRAAFFRKNVFAKKYQKKGYYISIRPERNEAKHRSYCVKEQELCQYYTDNYGFESSSLSSGPKD